MEARGARLQFQSEGVAPGGLVARLRRAMIFGTDNLEALNNRKVVARLWLNGREIVLLGARPHFHHHKLLETARRLRPIMADGNILGSGSGARPTRLRAPIK
jgi:hypothetical protein